MSNELKPCPFCGGKPRIDTEYDMDGFGNFHKVECSDCGASSKAHFATSGNECPQYYQEVRDEWQKRAFAEPSEHLRLKEAECEELAKDKAELVNALTSAKQSIWSIKTNAQLDGDENLKEIAWEAKIAAR